MWWHHSWSQWNWLFMVLSMALFWGLVIGGIIWAVRAAPTSKAPPDRSPRDVLDDRYARGEINAEEYRRVRDTLAEP